MKSTEFKNEDDVVLKVEHVSKEYILGAVSGETLRDALKAKFGKHGDVHNKSFEALKDVSFEVRKGERVGLIGANGAGKSTILKVISRITAPTKGKVYIDGRVSSMLEVGTGFHPELTGRENIYLSGSILGMTRKEIDAKIDSIIEFSECYDFIDTPVKRYSSGMYVKLAFAIASHLDSEIMIMDEVLAVGDVKFQFKCLEKMKEIAETQGRTVLYVSHNIDTVQKLCNRCIVLDHGKLLYDGDVDEATRLYYGYTDSDENFKDFTNVIRQTWLTRDDVRITSAENLGFNEDTEELLLKIKMHCNKDIDSMSFRFELMDDNHHVFAVAISKEAVSCKAGEDKEAVLSLNLKNVIDGTYETYYTLYCTDAYKEGINIDCVNGLNLTISRDKEKQKLKWDKIHWGNIKLEPIDVQVLK